MFDLHLRSSFALTIALALAACTHIDTGGATALDAGDEPDPISRKTRPPPPSDAGTKPPSDAGGSGGSGGDPSSAGVVACGFSGNPAATCAAPSHCCFGNYSAQHDGECTTLSCTWGSVACDGPEDCPTGQRCCAQLLSDPDWGILGYKLACQATACGAAPAAEELCHPTTSLAGTCASGTACVAASSADYDLPPALHICQ